MDHLVGRGIVVTEGTESSSGLAVAGAEMNWYIVHTYSGYEHKAKSALEERVKSLRKESFFGEVIVPEENVVELVKGQKRTTKRRFFSGIYSRQNGPYR